MYKALKDGWLPYSEAFEKYVSYGDQRRYINKIPVMYKEKICNIWFVNSTWFKSIDNLKELEAIKDSLFSNIASLDIKYKKLENKYKSSRDKSLLKNLEKIKNKKEEKTRDLNNILTCIYKIYKMDKYGIDK